MLLLGDEIIRRGQHLAQVVARQHGHDGEQGRDHLREVLRVVLVENDQAVDGVVRELLGAFELIGGDAAVSVELDEGLHLEDGGLRLQAGVEALDDGLSLDVPELQFQIPFHGLDHQAFDAGFKEVAQVLQCRAAIGVDQALADRVDGLPRKPREGIGLRVRREKPGDAGGGFRGARPVAEQVDANGVDGIRRMEVRKRAVKELRGVHGLVAEVLVALGVENEDRFVAEGALEDEGVKAARLPRARGAEDEVVAFSVAHLLELVFVLDADAVDEGHADLLRNELSGLLVVGNRFPRHENAEREVPEDELAHRRPAFHRALGFVEVTLQKFSNEAGVLGGPDEAAPEPHLASVHGIREDLDDALKVNPRYFAPDQRPRGLPAGVGFGKDQQEPQREERRDEVHHARHGREEAGERKADGPAAAHERLTGLVVGAPSVEFIGIVIKAHEEPSKKVIWRDCCGGAGPDRAPDKRKTMGLRGTRAGIAFPWLGSEKLAEGAIRQVWRSNPSAGGIPSPL